MPRPLFDSPYIFGLHDPGGEQIMADMGRRGWIVFTEEVGSDPNNTAGKDFTPWSNQDFGVICRINNGYGSAGTIPTSDLYPDFARRVANFVAASSGCKIWVIGNEMNYSQEWPSNWGAMRAAAVVPGAAPQRGPDADPSGHGSSARFSALTPKPAAAPMLRAASGGYGPQMITPDLYARCFRLCRDAIKVLPGHGDDQVVVGAVAPWNDQAKYPGNEIGDWVVYLQDILARLGPGGCDGVALHTYTHGSDRALIYDPATMNPPFQNRHYQFIAYRDFMNAIPASMRELPVYITETDQDVPWLDANNGWVQAAYAEINWWNQQPGNQQIRALALYRWPPFDQWYIEGKNGVIADFREAMRNDYRWKAPLPKPANYQVGDTVKTVTVVNFRQAPGGAIIAQLPPGTSLTVLSSTYVMQGGLPWWNVRAPVDGQPQNGWVAQYTTDGLALIESVATPPGTFRPGEQVRTTTVVRMRRAPGTTNKPPDDVVADVPAGTVLVVYGGPQSADGMTWWRNGGALPDGRRVEGWMAEALADGYDPARKGFAGAAAACHHPATGDIPARRSLSHDDDCESAPLTRVFGQTGHRCAGAAPGWHRGYGGGRPHGQG